MEQETWTKFTLNVAINKQKQYQRPHTKENISTFLKLTVIFFTTQQSKGINGVRDMVLGQTLIRISTALTPQSLHLSPLPPASFVLCVMCRERCN